MPVILYLTWVLFLMLGLEHLPNPDRHWDEFLSPKLLFSNQRQYLFSFYPPLLQERRAGISVRWPPSKKKGPRKSVFLICTAVRRWRRNNSSWSWFKEGRKGLFQPRKPWNQNGRINDVIKWWIPLFPGSVRCQITCCLYLAGPPNQISPPFYPLCIVS